METDLSSYLSDAALQLRERLCIGQGVVRHYISSATAIELLLLVVSILLLQIAVRRSNAIPVTLLSIGLLLLAFRVVVGIAVAYSEPASHLLCHSPRYLGVLGWMMIAWYCFRVARSTGANIDERQGSPSEDHPGG